MHTLAVTLTRTIGIQGKGQLSQGQSQSQGLGSHGQCKSVKDLQAPQMHQLQAKLDPRRSSATFRAKSAAGCVGSITDWIS